MWYIASEENINYLAHHGVKGQRWGVRKRREQYAVNPNDPNAQRYAQQQRRKRIARNVAIGVGATAAAAGAGYLASRFVRNRRAIKEQTNKINHWKTMAEDYTRQGNKIGLDIVANDTQKAQAKINDLKKHIFKTGQERKTSDIIKSRVGDAVRNAKNSYKEYKENKKVDNLFYGKTTAGNEVGSLIRKIRRR